MNIKKIETLMFKCESGEWFNLQYLENIKVRSLESGYGVYGFSNRGTQYTFKSNFKTQEKAEKYINDLLTVLESFKET